MSSHKVRLGELCFIERGSTGITKNIPGEYPLVTLSEERKSHNDYQFDTNAVIIPLVSSTGHGHKSLKRIHYQEGKFALGSILCSVFPKEKGILNSRFLYWYLDLNKESELVSRMKGMANVSLPIKSLFDILIPLPSINNQIKIASKLDEAFKHKNFLNSEFIKQNNYVEKLKQSILTEAIQGKLATQFDKDSSSTDYLLKLLEQKNIFNKGNNVKQKEVFFTTKENENPFKIPNSWTWCKLRDIFQFIDYRGRTPQKTTCGKRIITAKNIKMGYIAEDPVEYISLNLYKNWMTRGFPAKGDLIFVTEGATMGNVAFVELDYEFALAQRTILLKPYLASYAKFCLYAIMSPFFQKSVSKKATGSAAMGIKSATLKELMLPLPPENELNCLVPKIEYLLGLCNELETTIQNNKERNEMFFLQLLREFMNFS